MIFKMLLRTMMYNYTGIPIVSTILNISAKFVFVLYSPWRERIFKYTLPSTCHHQQQKKKTSKCSRDKTFSWNAHKSDQRRATDKKNYSDKR